MSEHIKVCILGSGSRGNSIFLGTEETRVLIDAGLSAKETALRLAQIGEDIEKINAVCLSHEHRDHIAGLRTLQRKHHIPLYANAGTIEGVTRVAKLDKLEWNVFTTGHHFQVGEFVIESFSVPHDAYEPVGFIFTLGDTRIGVVIDAGMATNVIRERLKLCRVVVLESNHDEQLLQEAERPWPLKQRIKGRQGHLSNDHAAAMLAEIAGPQLEQVFLAHLSEDCNRGDLALETTRESLRKSGHHHVKVSLTFPDRISEVWAH